MNLPFPPQYSFMNSAFWLGSPSLNASLSTRTCKELIVLTKDAQTKGAQQNAYANTTKALTTPFRYQGKDITKRAPMIPNHVVRTENGWRRKMLITMEESEKEPSRYRGHPSSGCTVLGMMKKGMVYAASMDHATTTLSRESKNIVLFSILLL